MAGFKTDEPYFVPRCLLDLPHSTEYYVKKLVPNITRWRSQSAGRGGDKSSAANKFLNHIIPYFVETLVQDGIYMIKDFPEHPISCLLKVS